MLLVDGRASGAADRLCALLPQVVRLGGSDAQREVVEDTLIAALLRADRFNEARPVIDRRSIAVSAAATCLPSRRPLTPSGLHANWTAGAS